MKSSITLLLAAFGILNTTLAQHNSVMNLFPELQQSGFYANPAYHPQCKTAISMPVLGHLNLGAYNTGLQLNRLVAENPDYSIDQAANDLEDINFIGSTFNVSHAMTGFRVGKAWLRTGVSENIYLQFDYPRELFRMVMGGLDVYDFSNGPVSISGTGVQFMHYRSLDFGVSLPLFEEKLNIGINARYINGLGALWTKESNLTALVDTASNTIALDGRFDMYSSGTLTFLEEDLDFLPAATYLFNKQNHGAAVDLGLQLKLTEKLSVSAAVNNVGVIGWRSRNANYQTDSLNLVFSEPDVDEISENEGEQTDYFTATLDSLNRVFGQLKNTDRFNMPLPVNFNATAAYQLNEKYSVHVQMMAQRYFNEFYSNIGAGFKAKPAKWVALLPTATLWNMKDLNFGIGIILKPGPVQFSFFFDNLYGLISPDAQRNASAGMGINFVF